jgi:transcriptional regulator with XRE-family HTH domain
MESYKIAQKVKELRKLRGLSQEELTKQSGLSLRTVQRVENGETRPTGETLKRISVALDVPMNELIQLDEFNETPKKTVKTKFEYFHIYNNKIAFSQCIDITDLTEDYRKNVSNVFKTLTVFFIFIPLFTAIAILNFEKTGLAIFSASCAFLFLITALYTMLFTSGTSLIRMENISKILIKTTHFHRVLVIYHIESGRIKERTLILEKDQIETTRVALLTEGLIIENDISLKNKILSFESIFIILPIIIAIFCLLFKQSAQPMYYNGIFILLYAVVFIIRMIRRTFQVNPKNQQLSKI